MSGPVRPAFRGAVSATAHPDGCAEHVRSWIRRSERREPAGRPPRVLVVGASGGLGLAARIAASFGAGARSVGVCLERPGTADRPGSAGWYRVVAFEQEAERAAVPSVTVVGDAFADETKRRTCEAAARLLGQVDLLVYALATGRRRDSRTGVVRRSVLKTIGAPFRDKSFDLLTRRVAISTVDPATPQEIDDTVAVMGGEDWAGWIEALGEHDLIADGMRTVALSYEGPRRLHPTYRDGTMGRAKRDLEATAGRLGPLLRARHGGTARIAVMRALVTQSSVVIPMSALYTVLLLRVAAERGAGEDTLDQGERLMRSMGVPDGCASDARNRLRLDDLEMHPDLQAELWRRWDLADTANLADIGDIATFDRELRAVYGFGLPEVDYAAPVDLVRQAANVVMA
ncbi:enoyl-[acyl-carrier-protein] reductase FabV [Symbioplanes lichenis]|uniref:enoyl-[acyl-carrier-protein] reductase FabV n=1 Tax=Symbioplanes lichenis TaxID=1629072 RepID=UPI0027384762|nr:enoyl-[acyl-carrier-protein] reductase FabV [Actinoplanes lichenis]